MQENKRISIVLAEDERDLREILGHFLSMQEDFEVLPSVENGKKLLELLENTTPDIVLLDIMMPVMTGHEALPLIRKMRPQTKVIMMTALSMPDEIKEMIRQGASSYMVKPFYPEELSEAVRICHKKGFYLGERTARILVNEKPSTKQTFSLSDEQLLKLFSLATGILEYVAHDLGSQTSKLYGMLRFIEEKVNLQSEAPPPEVTRFLQSAQGSAKKIGAIRQAIRAYAGWSQPEEAKDLSQLFVTRPAEIIEAIKEKYQHIAVMVDETSQKDLEIVYPPNVLRAILSELIENASKVADSPSMEVLIAWEIKNGLFQCEIHDSGPGFPVPPFEKFVSIDYIKQHLQDKAGGLGLPIISKSIVESGGKLFFARSKRLNGAFIYFDFPVFGYKK